MSVETLSHGAVQSYIDKWLAVQPEQRAALVFVDPGKYPGHVALAAFEQEILAAAYGIREPHVAATKLNWWAEELSGAAASGGRHPLTRILFADERAAALPLELWLAPVLAAMAQLEEGTAVDFNAQLAAASALHGALAALETQWWYGAQASSERAARLATLGHLLFALRRLQDDADRDRLPLPMSRLARFGLNRASLREASAERDQALAAQLADLRQSWTASRTLNGPLSVFRAVEAGQGTRLLAKAQKATQPLSVLQQGLPSGGFGATWRAWRAATAWQRQVSA